MKLELVSKLEGDYIINSKFKYRYLQFKSVLDDIEFKLIVEHFGGLPIYSIPESMTFVFSMDKLTPDMMIGVCTKLDIENGYAEIIRSDTELSKSFTEKQLNDCKLGFLAIGQIADKDPDEYGRRLFSINTLYALQLIAKGRCL